MPHSLTTLASDLDGTLLPAAENGTHKSDLATVKSLIEQHHLNLLYVTGRSPQLLEEAISQGGLPRPTMAICDVGSTLLEPDGSVGFRRVDCYEDALSRIVGNFSGDRIRSLCSELPGIQPQEPHKQARFKVSFYCEGHELPVRAQLLSERLAEWRAPWRVVESRDPQTNTGLLDLLPTGVSKAFALSWWCQQHSLTLTSVAFAGDSGNDLAALTCGCRAIVVGNADPQTREAVISATPPDQHYIATKTATSGVLEGLQHWLAD